jgi:hypothetical protein
MQRVLNREEKELHSTERAGGREESSVAQHRSTTLARPTREVSYKSFIKIPKIQYKVQRNRKHSDS